MLPIEINGPVVGIVLKDLTMRAMSTIRRMRFAYEAKVKEGYTGNMDDVFTDADTAAQAIFEKLLPETLPGVGILGEEGLRTSCTIPGLDAYVTIDPLDGTRAFVRRQSHGVAVMVALVVQGEVVSAWVGDVFTNELYGYRPDGLHVHHLAPHESSRHLETIPRVVQLSESYGLLREYPKDAPPQVHQLITMCKNVDVGGGSIGSWFTRLWKGEVACALLDPGSETPWDSTPVIGISERLGFVFLRARTSGGWEQYEPSLPRQVCKRDHYTLVIHESMKHHFCT
jgi:fructose-1,6-bisphosphatase/inositol monophosphatase family enzyme